MDRISRPARIRLEAFHRSALLALALAAFALPWTLPAHAFTSSPIGDTTSVVAPTPEPVDTALVLSGGGAKGAFEVGAVKYLYEERGFRPDAICGTSIGAVIGGKLAEGGEDVAHELENVWRGISGNPDILVRDPVLDDVLEQTERPSELIGLAVRFFAGSLLDEIQGIEALYSFAPARDLIEASLDRAKVAASGIELRLAIVDLGDGGLVYADQFGRMEYAEPGLAATHPHRVNPPDIDLVDAILASGAAPVIYPPIHWNGRSLVDGGVRDVVPVDACLALQPSEMMVLVASPLGLEQGLPETDFALLANALRSEAIVVNEVLRTDLRGAESSPAAIDVIAPALPLQSPIDFGRHVNALHIYYGFETARVHFEGGPGPEEACLLTAKDLANRLDEIDVAEGWLESAAKDGYIALREEQADALRADLDALGCPGIPGLTMPVIETAPVEPTVPTSSTSTTTTTTTRTLSSPTLTSFSLR